MKEQLRSLFTDVWNVPNVLTMLRLALVPVFVAVYAAGANIAALCVFCLASFTDMLDGMIARKYHLITSFGKLMDPLADKLMVCAALICLATHDVFPWVAIILVALKELIMIIGGAYMLKQGIVVYSNMLGKTAQVAFISSLILGFFHEYFVSIGYMVDLWLLWLSVALCFCALVDYSIDAYRKLKIAGK